tara:strand:- start:643 stop:1182 length:540 start_codon:yes stop_codon:yes gene_type:complete
MSISTKTGDNGNTYLFDGSRIGKNSKSIDAIGSCDELNSLIGLIQSNFKNSKLITLQNELFVVGSDIATPLNTQHEERTKRIKQRHLDRLENECSILENKIGPIKNFVLPGGHNISAKIQYARTVCRRLETNIIKLNLERNVNEILIKYINRLSDYLFLFALDINNEFGIKNKDVNFEI